MIRIQILASAFLDEFTCDCTGNAFRRLFMEEITGLLNTYRECARNLWNVYMRHQIHDNESSSSNQWDMSDEFDDICTKLFHMLVLLPLKKINYEKTASYKALKDTLSFLQVVPKHEVPILINREKNSMSGYWDHPINRIKPDTTDMRFIDYFDFDKLGYRNFEYYQVRIVASSAFPDLTERDALVSPQYVNVFFNNQ